MRHLTRRGAPSATRRGVREPAIWAALLGGPGSAYVPIWVPCALRSAKSLGRYVGGTRPSGTRRTLIEVGIVDTDK